MVGRSGVWRGIVDTAAGHVAGTRWWGAGSVHGGVPCRHRVVVLDRSGMMRWCAAGSGANGGGGRAGYEPMRLPVAPPAVDGMGWEEEEEKYYRVDEFARVLVERYPGSRLDRVKPRVFRALSRWHEQRQRMVRVHERGAREEVQGPRARDESLLLKLDLLDSISYKLGWKVFYRYPEEFAHEDAYDLWCIMTAILFTTGFSPESISMLLSRHPCLFASTVRDPDNIKTLFEWIQKLQILDTDSLRIINRFPLILQTPVNDVLKPRFAYLSARLDISQEQTIAGIVRHPELLSVDSNWIQERIDFYVDHGLSLDDLGALFVSQPAAFAVGIDNYLVPMIAFLEDDLQCDGRLLASLLVKSGMLSRSVNTMRSRAHMWMSLGLTKEQVRGALRKFPRFLLYPVSDPKYVAKLTFLREEMNLPLSTVASFPQYMSYSLEKRIAPRVLITKALTGQIPKINTLAMTEKSYLKANGLDVAQFQAAAKFVAETAKGSFWIK